jgi:copper(I)-binding protein
MKLLSVLSIFMLAFVPLALAETEVPEASNITVTNAYTYATSKMQKNGAVFMEITNTGVAADKLLRVDAGVSRAVELHTHTMDGDVMMMREVEGYDVAPGETVVLEPMGHHIMLMGLNALLVAGEKFKMTLVFNGYLIKPINVLVKSLSGDDMSTMEMPATHDEAAH